MKLTSLKLTLLAVVVLGFAVQSQAQNRTRFAGRVNAVDYAYGIQQGIAPLQVATGNASTGTASITVVLPCITAGDGTTVCPLATNAPILVGVGSTQDSITPSTVSGCNIAAGYGACTITASFTYTHGTGEQITTGSYGVEEAINLANMSPNGGGVVVVDPRWALLGGTTAKITAAAGFSNVIVEDTRAGDQLWSLQPSTLTSLAVPATLVAGTVVFAAAPVGTWANSAYYFCVTYVDALGGEGPCSLTYNQTPTLNYSVTVTAPAASTGAVGWRLYSGASYNAAYLMPIDSTHCTLTTLESVMPACAIGSNGAWIAPPLTTTILRPNATVSAGALSTPTVNILATQPQGHTTFAYQPTSTYPQPFQTHYGPFPAFGSTTSGQVDILGSINLPAGFLNTIGRVLKLRGKITTGTLNTAALPTLTVVDAWVAGTTAGAGIATCAFEGVAVGATKVYNGQFECVLNTNAVGATAVGSVMPGGSMLLQDVSLAANGLGPYVDNNTAVVGSLGLFAQDTLNITYTSNTNTTGAPQLLALDVEVAQ